MRTVCLAVGLLSAISSGAYGQAAPPSFEHRADSIVQAFQQRTQAPGVVAGVLRGGTVIYAKGFGVTRLGGNQPVTVRTIYHMASISKPFVATAIMQLVEAGKVSLDAPVTRYLPYFRMKDPRYRAITIKEMLNHTAGMPDVTDYHWDHPEYDAGSLERWVRGLADSSLIFAPGTKWQYSNIAFEVLADVIAKVSGEVFEDYIQRHILTPAGMRHSTMLMTDVDSANLAWGHGRNKEGTVEPSAAYPYNRRHAASSTMHSNVEDMLRWATINLNHGELDGHRILDAKSYDALWTPTFDNTKELRARATQAGIPFPYDYFKVGLSWFILGWQGRPLINHSGGDVGFRTDLYLDPTTKSAVVVMANLDRANVNELALALLRIVR